MKGKGIFHIYFFLSLLLFSTSSFSLESWKVKNSNTQYLDLNTLNFSNRAKCALDSKKPADSVFLFITNVELGKSLQRLARFRGIPSKQFIREGIVKYRESAYEIYNIIHQKLVNGKLPLLPLIKRKEKHIPKRYKAILETCQSGKHCAPLKNYLAELWDLSDFESPDFSSADNFKMKKHFFVKSPFTNLVKDQNLSCHHLKKFGPIESHLFGTKPNKQAFGQLGQALNDPNQYLGDCRDYILQKEVQGVIYQVDYRHLKNREWKKKGHAYWNSMTLFFSWAMRESRELEYFAGNFTDLFSGMNVEESIYFLPNGCKSLRPAECNLNDLSNNAIREMAKSSFRTQALQSDLLSDFSRGPQEDLLDNQFVDVNNDINDLARFENAEGWLNNFRSNIASGRAYTKRKLINSVNKLNAIQTFTSPQVIASKAYDLLSNSLLEVSNQLDHEKQLLKEQAYYLCSEYIFAANEDLDFSQSEISILEKSKLLDGLVSEISPMKVKRFYSEYKILADNIQSLCNKLEKSKFWESGDKEWEGGKKEGLSSWYLSRVYEGKVQSQARTFSKRLFQVPLRPLLSYSTFELSKNDDHVVCYNAIHCAREVLASIVGLRSVINYADTFLSMKEKIKSPDLFNPYAERLSCKVYDPWYKTKSAMLGLANDVASAALSVFSKGFVYANAFLKPGRVTSFNQLVDEGVIEFDPNVEPHRIAASLSLDFGPLVGIPCAVSISGERINPLQPYHFAGVSVGGCYGNETNVINVNSAADDGDSQNRSGSACVQCRLNFESVIGSISAYVPVLGPAFFIFRGLVRLVKTLKDPHDIPKSWSADVNNVSATFRKYGVIPKRCVSKLRRGGICLENSCEEVIVTTMQGKFKDMVENVSLESYSRTAEVKMKHCREPFQVELSDSINREGSCGHVRKIKIPSSCSGGEM